MDRPIRLSAVAIVIALLLSACGGDSSKPNGYGLIDWPTTSTIKTGPEVGNRAPNFQLQTPDGQVIELSTYAGKPLLLNFFASWCANCKEEMQALDTASKNGATVIGINYQESAAKVTELAAETGATFPLVLDPRTEVSRTGYRVTALPVTILIDGDGIIREIVRGPVDDARLQELLDTVQTDPTQSRTS